MQPSVLRLKNNSIKRYFTSHFLKSRTCLGLALLFSLAATAQVELVESLQSDAQRIVIDLGIIDHLTLVNSEGNELRITAENAQGVPRTELQDKGKTLYIGSTFTRQIEEEPLTADKLCSIEPLYPSFQVSIPRGRTVAVSIGKGNLYAESYQGDLGLRLEEGLVRLDQINGRVRVQVNRGRIWVSGLDQSKVTARTSMGELVLKRRDGSKEDGSKQLEEVFGDPARELEITTVMGSIYLDQ